MHGQLPEKTRKDANLRLLQRSCDANIIDILQSANHGVLYEYKGHAWHKSGMEGSCFLTESNNGAMHFIIVNRSSVENFCMTVTKHLQLQHQDPYLILQQADDNDNTMRCRGVWFPNANDRVAMHKALESIVHKLQQGSTPPRPHRSATPAAAPTAESSSKAAGLPRPDVKKAQTPSPSHVDAGAAMAAMLSPMSVRDERAQNGASSPAADVAAASTSSSVPAGVALDKKSLQLALLSLIQDDRFIDLIHSQYLRVVQARAKNSKPPGPAPK